EDNGIGINNEDMLRVGQPYFQASNSYDRRHGGTGLGLSIVKGLIDLHGGEFSIRSRIGEGTRVTVRLPLECGRTRSAKKSVAEKPPGVVSYLITNAAPAMAGVIAGQESPQRCAIQDPQNLSVKKS